MSYPNIPNVTPTINLNRDDVVNLLLASIAFEELGLAHVINAEAEKIQAALGTLPNTPVSPVTNVAELLEVNDSVNKTLKTVTRKELLLQLKLEDILEIPPVPIPGIQIFKNTATVTASFEDQVVTDADSAYYYINIA